MHAIGFAAPVTMIDRRLIPLGYVGFLQEIQQGHAFQTRYGDLEQAGNGRVGESDTPVFVDHQNAFGGIFQYRSIERLGYFQITAQAAQRPGIALMFQQRLHFGFEDLRIEGLEQVIDGAARVALEYRVPGLCIAREKNNRGEPRALAAAHQSGNFKPVHAWHVHIQQHQIDLVTEQQLQGFYT